LGWGCLVVFEWMTARDPCMCVWMGFLCICMDVGG
jgi:hypothetical protein